MPQRCLGSSPCSSSNFATCDNGQEACDSGQEDNGLVRKFAGDQFADHVADCLIPLDGAYARARQGANMVTDPSENIVTNPVRAREVSGEAHEKTGKKLVYPTRRGPDTDPLE